MFRFLKLFFALAALTAISISSAYATGADFTSLTSVVDFTSAGSALLVVFANAAGLGILWAGGSLIVRKVFGGGK